MSSSQATKSLFGSWFSNAAKDLNDQIDKQNEEKQKEAEAEAEAKADAKAEAKAEGAVEPRETESKVIDLSHTDSVVTSVVQSFLQRADFGFKKYGKTMDRDDLTMLQWIQHAQEEHMDAILYLEKLKQLETTRSKKEIE